MILRLVANLLGDPHSEGAVSPKEVTGAVAWLRASIVTAAAGVGTGRTLRIGASGEGDFVTSVTGEAFAANPSSLDIVRTDRAFGLRCNLGAVEIDERGISHRAVSWSSALTSRAVTGTITRRATAKAVVLSISRDPSVSYVLVGGGEDSEDGEDKFVHGYQLGRSVGRKAVDSVESVSGE